MPAMRFSLWASAYHPWDRLLAEARHAEATGWDGLWLADHFLPAAGPASAGSPHEATTALAGLAATVPRIRLGTLVAGNTYRHPAVLTKEAATIDLISGGRFTLGLGTGWQVNEHEAFGIELPPVGRRLDMLEEACEVVKRLTTEDSVTFEGRHYQLHGATLAPRPVQAALPLLVGGGGERRTLRIAARWADAWNTWGHPDVLRHKGEVLERHCHAIGRDPSAITRSAQVVVSFSDDGTPAPGDRFDAVHATSAELADLMGAYVEAGVEEFIVRDSLAVGGSFDRLDRFLEEVAAPHRG
jgi:F420-dependent oxidoreductase-like protein